MLSGTSTALQEVITPRFFARARPEPGALLLWS